MAARQFERIDAPKVCRTAHIDDVGFKMVRVLFDFLGLKRFDEEKV